MKVSVALCTYNGEKYLSTQLDSILHQTLIPDELIICDDGSTDRTIEILSTYEKKYPEIIKVFTNETNLGFIRNFEKAIYLCNNEIIIISDQDDVWEKNKIEETILFFQKNPDSDGVFHDLKLIDENSVQPSYLNWKNITHENIINDIREHKLFVSLVSKGSFILGCALAIRKNALEKYNIKDFPMAHDYFIVQILSIKNKLGFIPKALSSYRLHPGQVYGLRYNSEKSEAPSSLSRHQQYFKNYVWPYLKSIERLQEINPKEDPQKTEIYSAFIKNRNSYLKTMNFLDKKIYIAKCIRHKYLDLKLSDLFTI
ncbi:glycosyltransferase [Chryseobacterium sp. PTM-20240506]|uniref:glycosyltransferase n=1 Tax=unclassified Chryseobacterium TaxID=2593645 RepID=UPI002358445C|nr:MULTISPECIES: glycosyltransferase [unclassified Chryseobacterium]MDC8106324.1 glycosyltransferase [Chryseobacterium sp. B21-037]MDQ1804830.1 glycosyltransferase [Chryseobacterium sp. CKR4-1]